MCWQYGLSEKSFYYWVRKLCNHMVAADGPQLVQLEPTVISDLRQHAATSNNLTENSIWSFVVGRKNRLFCDSVKGAESSAIVYSLVETVKTNGIEPHKYLMLVLSMLPYLDKSPAHE